MAAYDNKLLTLAGWRTYALKVKEEADALETRVQTLEDAGGKYKGFIDALQSCLDVVNQNRQELAPQTAQAAAISGSYHEDEDDHDDDELDDLDEN